MGEARVTKARTEPLWIFGTGFNSGAVVQHLPEGSPDVDEFYEGKPLRDRFPARGEIQFSSGFRKFIKVLDSVANTARVPWSRASSRRPSKRDCEFLPVTLIDHKGKVASKDHFVLNVLRIEDAIDMKRSKYKAREPGARGRRRVRRSIGP